MEKRCEYWLPKKKRFCANFPFNDSPFCGNHSIRSNGKWIPCSIDPSHCVLEENMEGHLKRCPLLKQTQTLSLQPYYQKGINQGTDSEDQDVQFTSEMKRNWVYNLSAPLFYDLLSKIRSLHASICKDMQFSYKIPNACDIWIKRQNDRKIPYQEKHVRQQASILGNLEDFGALSSSDQAFSEEQCDRSTLHCYEDDVSAVVEFGAGRGYLTQILADCYGIEKVVLVERKAYKLKADRSLRQIENLALERLRIDIEDLNLNAVESLKGIPYLAIGKHLCGPATDLTLRCCLSEHCDQDNGKEPGVRPHLRSIAVATCCHHLCQWKHYTSKQYLKNLGITKEDFHAITWFTSWAVDADHGSDVSDDGSLPSPIPPHPPSGNEECGGDARGVEGITRNMKAMDRAALGFMCKDIIDMGRLMWIKECGLEAKLVKYVPSDISPENRLLVAKAGTTTIST
ncbi:tRNA:m(4)X modification enzyme TRM13 isoform X1 [Spinacia oleracea]|uniref:tRNA:m(4)X modification enzyme TRM13 n=1 Tax=Spinacia oleracea TaxID=3562 RepID=A0A9R0HT55_SPIOL|nr:tRNA:m(4)X modification enzyme TRM13 isoform X1 [Spinacia oleracea]XP_021836576.1 tRNA:m(4)X modification enzyme TRM13 isoform X1 [Spinacia oleracea]XP_056684493.1 tRNA:m(4)X modification enzyme TRM13 isoform X1 [Spinacia oleracea]